MRLIDKDALIRKFKTISPMAIDGRARQIVEDQPTIEERKTGRCMWCDGIEDRRLRIEFYWIDDEGNTASFSEPHMVATGIAKYCPRCGRKLMMGEDDG